MEETESQVRRTRSGRAKSTPQSKVAKTSKNSPKVETKSGPRRTRKKVVLMEVEVSDEDDENTLEHSGDEKSEVNESELEDKLLASPEESNDPTDKKDDVNGDNIEEKYTVDDPSITVVFNDLAMLQSEEQEIKPETAKKESETPKELFKNDKMDTKPTLEIVKSPEKKEPTPEIKDSPKKTKGEGDSIEASGKQEPLNEVNIDKSEEIKDEKAKQIEEKEPEKSEEVKAKEEKLEKNEEKKLEKNEEKKPKKSEDKLPENPKEKQPEKTEERLPEKPKEKQPEKTEEKLPEKIEGKQFEKIEEKQPGKIEEKQSEKIDEKKPEIIEEKKSEKTDEKIPEKNKEKMLEKSDEKKPVATLVIEIEKTKETEKKIEVEQAKDESYKMDVDEEKEVDEMTVEKMEVDEDENADTTKTKEKSKESNTSEKKEDSKEQKQNGDPDAENISEDELPGVPVVKVPEAEEVSDEELPGPKRAELPADTEVVSEDELPTVKTDNKKEGVKRKINETDDYDPGSPTSESEAPTKKPTLEKEQVEKEEKPKPKKLPELDKYWKAVNDDPTDFTGWTYLLQYVDQENDMEAAREAYDAFLSHYPYCYGYWRKYADYEKRKGNKKKCEEVFERGLKAIPLSVDLWIHYLTYVKTTRAEEEEFIRSQFDRALAACGLEFRSDRLWDSFIKWETEGKRLQKVTAIYDKLLATPTQGYTTHFDNFQEHVASNPPNKVIDVDEFLALRKEVRNVLKHDTPPEVAESDAPPGDEDQSKVISSDEETKSIRERIVSIRRKIHKATVNSVTARWNYEEGIKRPYFHVKPLERCQLKNWHDYLDYETEQGDRIRIIVLFERCLIACALYEEFWLKFVHYLENLKDPELQLKIRDVYERACTIHHLKKPNLHLQWAMFEETVGNSARAAEILVNLEKTVPNVLQIAYRRINLERRRADHEKCTQLYEHYISSSKNKMISSNIAIKYSRFCFRILNDVAKAQEVLKTAITKDPNNPRLYLQLIDLTLQKDDVTEKEVIEIIDSFLEKESTDIDQKTLFAQRKLEYLEDFGGEIQSVQLAYENYQKLLKLSKENNKKKEVKTEASSTVAKKEKPATQSSSQASNYGNYAQYGNNPSQPPYAYSGQQGQYNYSQYGQSEQYQYQNWQYPQSGYSGYNQWGGYGGGYGY